MPQTSKHVPMFSKKNFLFELNSFTTGFFSNSQKFSICIFIIFLFSASFIGIAFAEANVSNNVEKICKHRYENFKKMGDENFQKRYPGIPEMKACLFLFKSSTWDFEGKNLIDEKYSSKSEIQKNSKIMSKYKIGQSKYLVKFVMCKENNLKSNFLHVSTEKEQFLGTISRPVQESCGSFWVIMKTENPDKAKFSWDYSSQPNFQIARKLF